MFGIGLPELILIAIVALLVVGPERLPGLARQLGRQVAELRRALEDAKQSLFDESDSAPRSHHSDSPADSLAGPLADSPTDPPPGSPAPGPPAARPPTDPQAPPA